MLRLSVRPETVTGLTRMDLTDVYLSPDLSFMSATTSYRYNIKNGDKVVVTTPDGGQQECQVEAWNEIRQGYAYCEEKVDKHTVYYTNPNNDPAAKNINYIIYNGQVCYELNQKYFVEGEIIQPTEEDGKFKIKLEKKRWIDNSYLNIGEHSYEVNMDKIGGPTDVYIPDGEPVSVENATLWPQKDWYEVTKIIIRRNPDQEFDVSAASCGEYYPYIEIGDATYDLEPLYEQGEGCDAPLEMTAYGFIVNDVQYSADCLTYKDEYGVIRYREPDGEDTIVIDGQEVKIYSRIMATTEGDKLILYTDDHNIFSDGDKITAQAIREVSEELTIHSIDASLTKPYIVHGSERCFIKECLFDTVDVSGTTYEIIYPESAATKIGTDGIIGTVVEVHEESANGNYFHAKITDVSAYTATVETSTATKYYPSKLVRFYQGKNESAFRMVEHSDKTVEYKQQEDSEAYEITHNDGVFIEGRWHIIEGGFCKNEKVPGSNGDVELTYHAVSALTGEDSKEIVYYESDYSIPFLIASKYELDYTDYDGASMVICKPTRSATQLETNEMDAEVMRICGLLSAQYEDFTFSVKNRVFGNREITPEVEIDAAAWAADVPVNSGYRFDPSKDIQVHKVVASLLLKVPMAQETALNLQQEDMLTNGYAKEKREEAINRIVDMEREVYYPMEVLHYRDNTEEAAYTGTSNDEIYEYFLDLSEIKEIRLNFHFRTRQPDSWKVIEDQNITETDDVSNWFVTDYQPYRDILTTSGDVVQESSDLMGLLGFTDDDIFYQKTKVGKSFARISIYDSTDPFTQSLLHMSSIFMDEGLMFKKFIENRKNGQYLGVSPSEKDMAAEYSSATISVNAESVRNVEQYTSVTMDDSTRLSSRMIVRNKYATETSSEGYYLYMFKEYVNGLHPKSVYMRIDFNHAGFGRTIPMIMPLAYDEYGNRDHILKIKKSGDLTVLKEGVPLSMLQQQLYIQLICQYDRRNHKYVYYLPKFYKDCVKDGIMTLNLFELKIKNEATAPK